MPGAGLDPGVNFHSDAHAHAHAHADPDADPHADDQQHHLDAQRPALADAAHGSGRRCRSAASCTSIGGFTSLGGTGTFFPLTRRVHVYDMATRQWSELAALPQQAAGNHFGVATDGTYIYTVAGQIEDTYGAGTNTAWRYHIASNTWSQFVSLPEIRFGGAAFIDNGWLHFVGGDLADRETPTTDHWAINLANTGAGWQERAACPWPATT